MLPPATLTEAEAALRAAQALRQQLLAALHALLARTDAEAAQALRLQQAQAHGVAWAATVIAALEQALVWAQRLQRQGRGGELEAAILRAGFAEYLAQLAGGLPLGQVETFRAQTLAPAAAAAFAADPAVQRLRADGFDASARRRLAALLAEGTAARRFGDPGDDDPALTEMRAQFARFADDHAAAAQRWHLANALIPDAVVAELARLGVFGLTLPEACGGSGAGKVALCVVTEELSRAHIGLGSLGTRTEIAGELIAHAGTPAQQARWLPAIAAGTLIPTACFTEPDHGSDLGAIRTRALKVDGGWRVHGAKTWITHGARSDLMTLLCRTDPASHDWRGLSMFVAAKPRGSDADPFPAPGMHGSELEVLGYRGLKEYEIGFDGFFVPDEALLGGAPGQGFKQLMRTFESARIQTAARALGVAQAAFELGLAYALQRRQFGCALIEFPRVADKLAWMAVQTCFARQLTLAAARAKDAGRRCDLEAGMAKLLAAQVAWSNADAALQVHGGSGYALESPISRLLCDARILSVFEGTAEIQANIVARALLG